MEISRELAIQILKYCNENKNFYFPFLVVCKEYSPEDDDFVEIESNEWDTIESDPDYKTFQLWENLQNLKEETVELLARGFIEKITQETIENKLKHWIKEYRDLWKEKLCESENIEEYGLNEFFGGKAEGFEEALEIIKKDLN